MRDALLQLLDPHVLGCELCVPLGKLSILSSQLGFQLGNSSLSVQHF